MPGMAGSITMAQRRRPPSFRSDAASDPSRRSSVRRPGELSLVAEAQPLAESGIWRLAWRGSRRHENAARASRGPTLRAALAWGLTLLFLSGAVTLCALTLVEIAERLVELGGVSALPRATD